MRVVAILACAVTLICGAPSAAHADSRVALVIGNSAYRSVPRLDNPVNDARLMAETLRGLGFTLVGGGPQLDLDKPGVERAIQGFGRALLGADVALFYYAGHGVQVRGGNFLLPIDANPEREADIDFQMLDVNLVLRQMEGARTRLNMVILDACRNNPFGGRSFRGVASGLASMEAPEGTLIAFATAPDRVASDGTDGNSPYTKALAATVRQPGLGLFDTFNQVGLAVRRATNGAQQPWFSSSPIAGSFYFAAPPSGGPAVDEIAWNTIKETIDIAALRRFIAEYPGSARLNEATARIAALDLQLAQERARHEAALAAAVAADASTWAKAATSDSTDAYYAYLAAFPLGQFRAQATRRIDDLRTFVLDNVTIPDKGPPAVTIKRIAVTGANFTKDELAKFLAGQAVVERVDTAMNVKAERISISEMVLKPENGLTISLPELTATNIAAGTVGELIETGFSASFVPSDGSIASISVTAGRIEIGSFNFARFLAIANRADVNDMALMLSAGGYSGRQAISGLEFQVRPPSASLRRPTSVTTRMESIVSENVFDGDTPASSSLRMKGMTIELANFDRPVLPFDLDMADIGATDLTVAWSYNRTRKALTIDEFKIATTRGGSIGMTAVINRIEPSQLSALINANPNAKPPDLTGAELANATLRYVDGGIFNKALNATAREEKKAPDAIKSELNAQMMKNVPVLLGSNSSSSRVAAELSRFIANPRGLTITVAPKGAPIIISDLAKQLDKGEPIPGVDLSVAATQ